MATPPFLRDFSPRLKALASPVVWAPLTIAALLGIFVWEFSKNPDWFNRDQITNLNPDSGLTPEEQARLSEIDTLDILLEQSKAPEGNLPAKGLINPDNAPALETTVTDEDELSVNSRQLTGKADPFGAYEAEYAFPGSNTATLTPSTLSSTSAAGSNTPGGGSGTTGSTGFNFGNGVVNPAAPATNSALAEALNRQQAARSAAEENNNTSQPATTGTDSSGIPITSGQSSAPVSIGQSNGQFSGAQPTGGAAQALPTPRGGVTVPFTQAPSLTSPPVGTTGYRPPVTTRLPVFNTAPPQATPNPFSVQNNNSRNNSNSPAAAPQSNTLYTAPTSIQPAQNQQRR